MPKVLNSSKHPYGPSFAGLIDRLAKLPGIGRKSAERMAYYLLNCDPAETRELAESLRAIREMDESPRGRKGDVDSLAATVLLQNALDTYK